MIKRLIILPAVLLSAVLTFYSCSFGDSALSVSDLKITKVDVIEKTSTTTDAPVTYNVTVTWNTTDIEASETASAAFDSLEAYIQDGTTMVTSEKLKDDTTSYTFKGLTPGESKSLRIKVNYVDDAFPDASFTDYTASVNFMGGPWYNGTTTAAPNRDTGFSVGSFNHLDSMPSSFSSPDQVYYYNSYNEKYQFTESGEVIWLVVKVNEVTDTNDTDTQRNNVQWLNKNFQLFDASISDLSSYNDIAEVDAEIVDIYGNSLLSISGTKTKGTMSDTNFNTLLESVDSGYYADEITGYYFIKATCKAMPSTYSEANAEKKLGIWGFANNGARRN